MRMGHIVFCGLFGSKLFFHIISYKAKLKKKKSYWTENVCFDFLYNFFPEKFAILRRTVRYIIKHVSVNEGETN
jgi:hypothetical protein